MRKNALSIVVIGLLLCSVVAVVGASDTGVSSIKTFSVSLPEPVFIEKENGYLAVELDGATSSLMRAGKPVLPVITKTFTFPLGTKIKNIDVSMNMKKYTVSKKVEPAPKPVTMDDSRIESDLIFEDKSVYDSKGLYPESKYSIDMGAGLKDGMHVLYVNVRCYAQYSPSRNVLYVPEQIDIKISYSLPEKSLFKADEEYDLVIITDEKFNESAQRLAEHKESVGMKTKVVTTQYIYSHYEGRDQPEQIKLFIKDAIEKWGVTYVLLMGGRKGQTLDWYVPERRSNNNADMESGYSTDLYYADIYRVDHAGNVWFEDWDWNGNGIFAEAEKPGRIIDRIDYYPDVYVGRLPVRYTWDADTVVDKIIHYEKSDNSWFKKAIMISGDTFPPSRGGSSAREGIYEGELSTGETVKYLKKAGFEIEKLWTSLGTLNSYEDVVNAFNEGPGFIHFAGHGNPAVWGNFLPDAQTEEEFVIGMTILDIWKYSNGYHLPIIMIGGCHNAQFNVTMQYLLERNENETLHDWFYPYDTASLPLIEEDGGSIASMGYTGYGYGYINEYCLKGLGGWIEPRFFYNYAVGGKEYLGEVHSQTITDYISIIGGVNSDIIDRKTIESWVLLGDPSLKIGGYGIEKFDDEQNTYDDYNGDVSFTEVNAPVWNKGMKWKYKISDVDFTLDEVEGRYVDIHIKTGYLELVVDDITSDTYVTKFSMPDSDIRMDINFWIREGEAPIVISGNVSKAVFSGYIYWDKENMGIKEIDLGFSGKLDLSSLPLNLSDKPRFVFSLLKILPFRFNIDLQIEFNQSYQLFSFPLVTGKSWGLPPAQMTIDGTVSSKWFQVLNILNKLTKLFGKEIVPPELEDLLPVINIRKVLEIYNLSNVFNLPHIDDPLYRDLHPFLCKSQRTITVDAGTFNTNEITMIRGIGQIFYSPDVANVVKIQGNFHELLPIVENIEMELVETG